MKSSLAPKAPPVPKASSVPEISIVIPTYKRPHLLKRCLNSLIKQTLNHSLYEIIVIDDAKQHYLKKDIKSFCKKNGLYVRYLSTKGSRGPAAARNKGWKNAKGQIIAFIDDDVIAFPDWLKQGYDGIKNGAKVIAGKTIVPVSSDPVDYEASIKNMEKSEFLTANLFILKRILKRIKGFDENFTTAFREDSDLQFTLLEKNIPIRCSSNLTVFHPVRKSNWAVSLKEQKKSMFNALLFKKHPLLFREKIQKYPPLSYYAFFITTLLFPLLAINGNISILSAVYIIWAFSLNRFIFKRLKKSSHSLKNTSQVILTSLFIPYIAVFWRLYGAVKYKVFFL